MDKPVDGGCRGGWILEDFTPLREGQIAGKHDAAPFVSVSKEGEEDLHLVATLLDIPYFVDDKSVVTGHAFQVSGELQIALGKEQFLYEQAAGGQADPPLVPLDEFMSKSTEQMGLPAS